MEARELLDDKTYEWWYTVSFVGTAESRMGFVYMFGWVDQLLALGMVIPPFYRESSWWDIHTPSIGILDPSRYMCISYKASLFSSQRELPHPPGFMGWLMAPF